MIRTETDVIHILKIPLPQNLKIVEQFVQKHPLKVHFSLEIFKV